MVVCSFQFGAPDFKCSPQSAQLAIESGKSHLHSVHTVASYFPWETPKAYRSRIQFDQVAFVIGQKSKAAKLELARDSTREVKIRRLERRCRHRAHYIG